LPDLPPPAFRAKLNMKRHEGLNHLAQRHNCGILRAVR